MQKEMGELLAGLEVEAISRIARSDPVKVVLWITLLVIAVIWIAPVLFPTTAFTFRANRNPGPKRLRWNAAAKSLIAWVPDPADGSIRYALRGSG